MASCLPYPIPNPSRPVESLKAAPWHLLAISLKSLSSSGMEKKPKGKQTKGWLLFLTKYKQMQMIPARSAYKQFEDSKFEKKNPNKIIS